MLLEEAWQQAGYYQKGELTATGESTIFAAAKGRLAQRESTAFTRQGSLVQSQYRPPEITTGAKRLPFFLPLPTRHCQKEQPGNLFLFTTAFQPRHGENRGGDANFSPRQRRPASIVPDHTFKQAAISYLFDLTMLKMKSASHVERVLSGKVEMAEPGSNRE